MQFRINLVLAFGCLIALLNISLPVAVAQVYYVGDQSTLKDNMGVASYHDALNWLNYHSPGGVIGGTDPIRHDDADGPGIIGNGRAVFDPSTDHRPNNPGGMPPDSHDYGWPRYLYFGDFFDERVFNNDKTVPGGIARPYSVEVTSGIFTFDLGSNINLSGNAGGLAVEEQIIVGRGANSNASLTIRNGTVTQDMVASWAGLTVGDGFGSNGQIIIDGPNAGLEIARDIWLGNAGGTGRIDVIDGGQLTARSIGPGLQNVPGTLNNSVLNVQGAGSFVRGISGINNGDLIVSGGGQVVSLYPDGSKNWGWLGTSDGSDGSALITGPGSSWTEIGRLTIGGVYHTDTSGTGHLVIDKGGYVESEEVVLANRSLSRGDVRVTGPGSQWKVTNYANLGDDGHGSVVIVEGGMMTTDGGATIGNSSNGDGSVTVTGDSSRWISGGQIQVGGGGAGQLTIRGGAVVQSRSDDGSGAASSATLGSWRQDDDIYGRGTATITGAGSKWVQDGVMNVGFYGEGAVNIEAGGSIESVYGAVARFAGSQGTVTVDGLDSSWIITSSMAIGGGWTKGGVGHVTVANQAAIEVGELLHLWDDGTLDVRQNGSVVVGASEAAAPARTVLVAEGGTLSGTGTILGNVLVDGGILSPGASPGILHIDGDLTIASTGQWHMELGGITVGTDYDQLNVTGNLLIDGLVTISFIDGFVPQVGDQFTFFQVGGQFNGDEVQLAWQNAPSGFEYDGAFIDGSLTVNITAVPEPSTWLLAACGALGLVVIRRRMRQIRFDR